MRQKYPKNQGFTILETLVAITILLIAITGPLTIAEQGLTEAVSSQDRLTALYIGQDLMEFVENSRDDNLLTGAQWLKGIAISLSGSSICAPGNSSPCDFDTRKQTAASVRCTKVSNLCQTYFSSSQSYYTPVSTAGPTTKFSRAFTIAIPGGGSPITATSAVLTVTVAWKTGTISDQVVLQDILFDTMR